MCWPRRARVAHLDDEEVARRRDFRDLPIVTIDGETARDFDDAVLVTERADGGYELQVHIADVAEYVRAGTDLDLEARLRGTSVYFPDRAIPMLPQELSTDICSLRPGEDRLVLSCIMQLDADGPHRELRNRRRRDPLGRAHDLYRGPRDPRRRCGDARALRRPGSRASSACRSSPC